MFDLSKSEVSSQLNSQVTNDVFHRMLEGKDHHRISIMFQFIAGHVNTVTLQKNDPRVTNINKFRSELVDVQCSDSSLSPIDYERITWLRKKMQEVQMATVAIFKNHCISGLLQMKFHLLNNLYEDLGKLCDISFLDVTTYKEFHALLSITFRKPSIGRASGTNDISKSMEPAFN